MIRKPLMPKNRLTPLGPTKRQIQSNRSRPSAPKKQCDAMTPEIAIALHPSSVGRYPLADVRRPMELRGGLNRG